MLQQEITLVTGGAGFLGRHLVTMLADGEAPVRVMDVREPDRPVAGVDYIRASITDANALRNAMQGVSRVFHLAGIPDLWSRDRSVFLRINRDGTQAVCTAAREGGVERLVYTSTALISEDCSQNRLLRHSPQDVRHHLRRLPGDYTRSKYLAEQAVAEAVEAGLDAVVVRPGALIGPEDDRPTPPGRLLLDAVNERLPAFVETMLSLIDVRDVARGHLLAAQRGSAGTIYELGGHRIRLQELLQTIQAMIGVRLPRTKVPHGLAFVAGVVESTLARVGILREPMSSVEGVRIARSTVAGRPVRNDFAKSLLPLRPLEQTLLETLRSFETLGMLSPRAARLVRERLESADVSARVAACR